MREKILLNSGWRFLESPSASPVAKTKAGMYLSAKTERLKWGPGVYTHIDVPEYWSETSELPEERWQTVDLPHDYIIKQEPDENETGALGFFNYHPAWYRRHFRLAPEDAARRVSIYFEGITGISDIYLNGCFLKHSVSGYASFEVDITDIVRFDADNVIAVYVDPSSYETWWYAGGGIYRNVWLVKTDVVAVDLWGVFVPAVRLAGNAWSVPAEVSVRNIDYMDVPVEIRCRLLDPSGATAGAFEFGGIAEARGVTVLKGGTDIENPMLWSVDTPQRYTLQVTVCKMLDGVMTPCDFYEQRFGFREILWSAEKGITLNGVGIKLQGVCGHLDFGLTGKAVPDNICRYKMRLYKEMGVNAFRTSHYPHQEAVMEACDELGLLVMDETRHFESNEDGMSQMAMLVKRDRNHPCVFLWSTGNEEMYHSFPQGQKIHRALEYLCRQLDPTRPVTSAEDHPDKRIIQETCSVIGVNYSIGYLDTIHSQYPTKPLFSSENCAVGSSRGWYYGDSTPERGLLDARDRNPDLDHMVFGREQTWKFFMERPWIAGGFQWAGIEHRGEAIWPRLCSVSGALDMYLQRKEAFYQNQSHWLKTPMVHMLPHWTHRGMDGLPINVWVYTNCEEVELFLNGRSLGRRTVQKYLHEEWQVSYVPGRLEAVGYNGGIETVRDAQETAGEPVALKLRLENGPVMANGEDIALFTCYAVDADGREVPDASPMVHFDCTGYGRIVGTGASIVDHVPVPSLDRRMYAGKISVAVRTRQLPQGAGSAVMRLFAKSEGLSGTYLDTVCEQ